MHGITVSKFVPLWWEDKDDSHFENYFRLTKAAYQKLSNLVGDRVTKYTTTMREPITTDDRLLLTLRYMATGDSSRSLGTNHGCGKSTVPPIVQEVLEAIIDVMEPMYLKCRPLHPCGGRAVVLLSLSCK